METSKMSVKISVVVPVYNVESYLNQCIDSLVNQTFDDFEIICINDGSTDSSLAILESYDDSRIKIITQENKGLSGARNTGIKEVSGEYTLFVDSDDWLELDALEKLYNNVKKLDSEILMFKFKYYYQNTNEFSEGPFTNLDCIDSKFYGLNFNYTDVLDILFKISHAPFNKLYKTSFLRQNNAEFPQGLDYEDLYFFYKYFPLASKVSVIDEFLYLYRIRDDSISTKGGKKSFDIFKIMDSTIDYLKEYEIYDLVKDDFLMFIIVNLKYVYLRLNEEFRDEYIGLMKEKYNQYELNQVKITDKWHYEDSSFYKSILPSNNHVEFDLNLSNFSNEFLASHYKTLANHYKQLYENEKNKSFFKRIVKS